MKVKKDKVKLITLGCSKNLVDSEHILAQLRNNDVEIVDDEDKCETVIVNTCGFIQEAKEESINTILRAVKKKDDGKVKNVYVAGCLSDRYKPDLEKEIPEVDKYFGATDKKQTLVDLLNEIGVDYKNNLIGERDVSTPRHYAYLKISEGCNNPCSFCAIPIMRGKHVSKPAEQVIMEAQKLASKGVKELIIIGQDTTYWGFDMDKKRGLAYLMKELSKVNGIEWIRLMYAYPSRFPEDLMEVINDTSNICKYIDIPIQHISDPVLKSMRRGITKKSQMELLEKLREKIPGVAIRTTLITGYPDETEKDFNELLDFVKGFRFDRLGVFTYSHEESTYAYNLPDRIPVKEKRMRQKLILDAQREISLQNNEKSIGNVVDVMIDRKENGYYIGRTYRDAPEIDQEVYINADIGLKIGTLLKAKIYDYEEFDLFAESN
ncbi:MAG: 30S ribosomal protein S12 methylthiotransferase RimO [Ignavibacteriae bacterium]|nr:30S ribosomal protein S12 methylthiotransferase RimO [Ignavibacteriota bacterium]